MELSIIPLIYGWGIEGTAPTLINKISQDQNRAVVKVIQQPYSANVTNAILGTDRLLHYPILKYRMHIQQQQRPVCLFVGYDGHVADPVCLMVKRGFQGYGFKGGQWQLDQVRRHV